MSKRPLDIKFSSVEPPIEKLTLRNQLSLESQLTVTYYEDEQYMLFNINGRQGVAVKAEHAIHFANTLLEFSKQRLWKEEKEFNK